MIRPIQLHAQFMSFSDNIAYVQLVPKIPTYIFESTLFIWEKLGFLEIVLMVIHIPFIWKFMQISPLSEKKTLF